MRIGLALGGGVVRGYAHIGVLSVLEREGIPIHCIAGASAGAIMGAMYAAGLSAGQIREGAMRLKWWHLARPVFPIRGLVSFAPMERWLMRALGDIRFEDLKLPFAAVATDLEAGQPITLREGRLAPAIRGSCSVPGLVVPLRLNGHLLCDGGISDNLPVSVARALGAEYVIGVNLFDPFIPRPRNLFSLGFAAIETMVRRAGGGIDSADCLISPDLVGNTYLRMSKRQELMAKGEVAAESQLECIRAAVRGEATGQASRRRASLAHGGEHMQAPPPESNGVNGASSIEQQSG
jgi:NTE family protein